jgi:phage-related protein
MPNSKPMPDIGPGCHELRINDKTVTWRIIYRIDADLILILEVFEKKSQKTPKRVIEICSQRAKRFDSDCE